MKKHKHHYVPKVYLKRFAADRTVPEPKQINLYNISRKTIISNASLRDQCYKRDFYGKTNELENALADIEGWLGSVLGRICESRDVPEYNSGDHYLSLLFVAIQMVRTRKHAEEMDNHVDMLYKTAFAEDPRLAEINLDDFKIGWDNSVIFGLETAFPMAICFDDLKIHLLEATPGTEFVTSDNPVFCYNSYLETVREHGIIGATQVGLQVFVPISPELCLLLYDGRVYKVGGSIHAKTVVSDKDMQVINALQFVSADENLYFSGKLSSGYFGQIASNHGKARRDYGMRVAEFEQVGNPLSTMLHSYHHIPNLRLDLSFLSIRRKARRIPMNKRLNMYRREPPEVAGFVPDYYDYHPEERGKSLVFRPANNTRRNRT